MHMNTAHTHALEAAKRVMHLYGCGALKWSGGTSEEKLTESSFSRREAGACTFQIGEYFWTVCPSAS